MKKRFLFLALALVMLLSCLQVNVLAANPYLPMWERVPDGEPHVFADPQTGEQRLYLYGSHDSTTVGRYCGPDHVVWSAPLDDLTNWRYEGVAFTTAKLDGLTYVDDNGQTQSLKIQKEHMLYAPDVAYNPVTKKYYMYVHIAEAEPAEMMFVASSDKPAGPFEDPHVVVTHGFDPSVLVDAENLDAEGYPTVYLVYGGAGVQNMCQVSGKDMYTVVEGTTITGGSQGLIWGEKDPSEDKPLENYRYFFEASSLRKIGDYYVLVYSGKIGQRDVGTLDYAYSKNPFGPYTFAGSIVDNRGEKLTNPYTGAAATGWITGNNHGGLVEINGQWYVFYHRGTHRTTAKRQGMIEPITIITNENGVYIPQVEMTSQGVETNGLNPYQQYNAGMLVTCIGEGYSMELIQTHTGSMDNWDPATNDPAMDWNPVVNLKDKTMIGYKYFNFADGIPEGKEAVLELSAKTMAEGTTVNVYASDAKTAYSDPEQPRTLIGFAVLGAADNQEHICRIPLNATEALIGKKGIYVEFLNSEHSGIEVMQLNKIGFVLENTLAITAEPETFAGKVGDTAVFSVETNRSDVTYQWYYSNNGWSWSKSSMEGATTDTLSVEMKAFRVGQQYKCVITDSEGKAVTSEIVELTVASSAAKIVENPADAAVSVGATATFAVKAEGEGLTYQWMYSNNGGATWSKSTASGSNTATLSIEAKAFRNGQMYKCIVCDAQGNAVESTAAAIVIEK